MKNITFYVIAIFCLGLGEGVSTARGGEPLNLGTSGIRFVKNAGQVYDQNFQSCPQVLYTTETHGMIVHLKGNGVSYQLYGTEKALPEESTPYSYFSKKSGMQPVYRVDLNWKSSNKAPDIMVDDEFPGYDNFYLDNCPNGLINVKSYKGITLKGVYEGIDVHYYESQGDLKHDYIVAPHANYRQIQVEVMGASIKLKDDGSVILSTPLGNVQEGAPVVFQKGKKLEARWKVTGNILSFEIENHDPDYQLVIDPLTRLWGTYYGGSGDDAGEQTITDPWGNIFMTGSTSSKSLIAITGGYNLNYIGVLDAYLVKFNSAGVRQWATYYGGYDYDGATSCGADSLGNVYMFGITSTKTSNVFATVNAHQKQYGGGNYDAFLVKFGSNGARLWSTFYGGAAEDGSARCDVDRSGQVFITGHTASNNNISTVNSHQVNLGGNYDVFIACFNSAGSRQWSTYYGGAGPEFPFTIVSNGINVYVTGNTATSHSSSIATPGSHQSQSGGGTDAFLVKLTTSGTRVWGTFYGGTGADYAFSCSVDPAGNVFLCGSTASQNASAIATPGCHQALNGGALNSYDGFLVKFDSLSVRQWGTFIGDSAYEQAFSCVTDVAGNIYLAGKSNSQNSGAISTPGSYQSASGGGFDIILAKFDGNGLRQWSTYYGGTGDEDCRHCTLNAAGNILLTGNTASASTNVLASNNSHQASFGGGNIDGFLSLFDLCDLAPLKPEGISGPDSVCFGTKVTYSTTPMVGSSNFNWLLPPGWNVSGNSHFLNTMPGNSGTFTLFASNACGNSPAITFPVIVNQQPTITVNSPLKVSCAGDFISLSANGATKYSVIPGAANVSNILISPTTTTTYTIWGTDENGCENSVILTQSVDVCTSLKTTVKEPYANLYPIPATEILNVELMEELDLTITDALGIAVIKSEFKNRNHAFNVSGLAPGIYFLQINGGNSAATLKFIKL